MRDMGRGWAKGGVTSPVRMRGPWGPVGPASCFLAQCSGHRPRCMQPLGAGLRRVGFSSGVGMGWRAWDSPRPTGAARCCWPWPPSAPRTHARPPCAPATPPASPPQPAGMESGDGVLRPKKNWSAITCEHQRMGRASQESCRLSCWTLGAIGSTNIGCTKENRRNFQNRRPLSGTGATHPHPTSTI